MKHIHTALCQQIPIPPKITPAASREPAEIDNRTTAAPQPQPSSDLSAATLPA